MIFRALIVTIGTAGVGFISFDLRFPHRLIKSFKEEIGTIVPPGYVARPRPGNLTVNKWCGAAVAFGDTEEWESYDTEFHELVPSKLSGNIGVVFIGAITGYVGIKGLPSSKLGGELRQIAEETAYELPPRVVPSMELLHKHYENEMYAVYTLQLRNRPFDVDDVKNLETLIGALEGFRWWGKQYAEDFRKAHKAVKGIGGKYRPRGVFTVTCGWRGWSLVSLRAKYSAKWKARVFRDDVKDAAEDVLKAFERYRVFDKVWYKDEWIG